MPSKQKKHVNSSSDTREKVSLTLISSIVMKSSIESGKQLLDVISGTISHVLKTLKESKDVHATLEKFLAILSPKRRGSHLSASRQAVSDNIMEDTRTNLDKKLHENYGACMDALEENNARSKEVILSIDTTAEEAKSEHLNDHYSYINVGQKNTWRRGFEYSTIHDSTHQLFISTRHQDNHHARRKNDEFSPFIKQIQESCAVVEQAGSSVSFINGDRAYYVTELFTAAYLGLLTVHCTHSHDPRMIVPKKFTREKEEKKIAFLEDSESKEVFKDYLSLPNDAPPFLKRLCESAGMTTHESLYQVPVVTVAMVDEYKAKSHRSLEELRQEWMRTKMNLVSSRERLDNLQEEYVLLQTRAGIREPKKIARITQRKRSVFRTRQIAEQYRKILTTMKYIKKLKRKKTELLNSLMFFTISASPHDDIQKHSEKFKKMARVYHERWGLENAFRDNKARFIRASRSRKPIHRQWNMEMGMMIYNRWHVKRMKQMLEIQRKRAWNKVPWDPHHRFLRRKLERENGMILSAESFLLQLLLFGIILRLEKLFNN